MRTPVTLTVLAVLGATISGCGQMLLPTSSDTTPIGKGKYSIKVYQGRGDDMYKKWEDEGARLCGGKKFKTKDRQYVKNPDGLNYLVGVIECAR